MQVARFVLLQPIIPLFKPIESRETLSRDSRAPPESVVLTWRTTTASNTTRVCKVGGSNVAKCDALNLGCLYQQLPDLQDPRRDTGACRKTVKSMIEAPAGILEMTGALIWKYGDHRSCAVGARLATEAKKLLDAVQGLDLNDMVC